MSSSLDALWSWGSSWWSETPAISPTTVDQQMASQRSAAGIIPHQKDVMGVSNPTLAPDDKLYQNKSIPALTPPAFITPRHVIQEISESPKKQATMADVAITIEDIDLTRSTARIYAKMGIIAKKAERDLLNTDYYTLIRDKIEISKQSANWAALHTTASVLGGLAVGVTGLVAGDPVGAWSGGAMVASGALSYLSSWLEQGNAAPEFLGTFAKDHPTLIGGLAIASGLMSLAVGVNGFQSLSQHLPALLATTITGSISLAQGVSTYQKQQKDAELTSLEGNKSTLETERTKNQDQMKKLFGAMKNEDLVRLSQAGSDYLEKVAKSIKQIIHGRSSH